MEGGGTSTKERDGSCLSLPRRRTGEDSPRQWMVETCAVSSNAKAHTAIGEIVDIFALKIYLVLDDGKAVTVIRYQQMIVMRLSPFSFLCHL
jgi:hypothetical protein